MPEPFAFRTPVAIPELGADPGDWIDYDPEDPTAVYVIREVPRAWAMDVLGRYRALLDELPADAHAPAPPIGYPRLQLLRHEVTDA